MPAPESIPEMFRKNIAAYINLVSSNLDLHVALLQEVPQYAIANAEGELLGTYLQRSTEAMKERQQQLRENLSPSHAAEFANRVIRGTINEYILHSPERLSDKLAEDIADMLESYLVR